MRSLATLANLLLGLAVVFWALAAKADCPHGTKENHPHCPGEPPVTRIVFLTSATFKGDLGNTLGCVDADGLDRADCICNELADAAGLGTNFAAWLSTSAGDPATSTGDPATDFFRSPVAYFRVDGVMVASSWADRVDNTILHPIEVDEQGGHPQRLTTTPIEVWTATNADGTADLSENCLAWTTDTTEQGRIGFNRGATNSSWTQSGETAGCAEQGHHLYCFEQE